MVPVNFHQLKQNIRQALLARAQELETYWDPFVAAWLCYALSTDGTENNQPLRNILDRMRRWLEEDAWSYERNLGPVALSLWLLKETGDWPQPELRDQLVNRLVALNVDEKLSLLRDSEQVFLLALGVAAIGDDSVKGRLIGLSDDQKKLGALQRRILYAAALRELGQQVAVFNNIEPADEGDIIAFVWWEEKYHQGERHDGWQRFSSIAEQITLEPDSTSENQRLLSVPEMAMLYQAVSEEAKHPEPALLFDYFPFHSRLREIAREHFMHGKYVAAVFEATKALNEMIQRKSGVTDKSETELVQATMKQISHPSKLKIRFNNFLDEESGKNEQIGLALIYEGVFKAFRNPKGHKPEDDPLIQLNPYEALQQLIVINYLMMRLEPADVSGQVGKGSYGE